MAPKSSLPQRENKVNDIGEEQAGGPIPLRFTKHQDLMKLYKLAYTEREIRDTYVLISTARRHK